MFKWSFGLLNFIFNLNKIESVRARRGSDYAKFEHEILLSLNVNFPKPEKII